jgi:predicted heme/steroid binding protein
MALLLWLVGRQRSPPLHVASAFEGKIMNISKDQVVQFLESQGNHDQTQQAGQQLPDQVDTDNGDHAQLLSRDTPAPHD